MRLLSTLACTILLVGAWTQCGDARVPNFCSGCDFSKATLSHANFDGAAYIGINFDATDLHDASFRGARLVGINFNKADLEGAAFHGAQCTACNFSGANLSGATFSKALMVATNFKGFAGTLADKELRSLLSGCVSCDFSGADLAGRDLSQTTPISVDFSRANLTNTLFDGAVLCWETFAQSGRQMRCDPMANAQTSGASFAAVVACDDPLERTGCTQVDATTLRQKVGSPLQGAVLP